MPKDAVSDIADGWRAGFEIEVVLGDLGQERFAEFGAMDIATDRYCQAVARELTQATGAKWTAPRKQHGRTGFFVVPEYDIDPGNFPYQHQIAGVELITPPLPLGDAEEIRETICAALIDLGGEENADRDDLTSSLGWHINIDSGNADRCLDDSGNADRCLDAAHFAAGVDEVAMLRHSGRLGGRYTGLQRHGFGASLLREMRVDKSFIEPDINLRNFLVRHAGRTKEFAANFAREGYVELRHYGTSDFFSTRMLSDLIGEPIRAFQMDRESAQAGLEHLLATFRVLENWLNVQRDLLDIRPHEPGRTSIRHATLLFDGSAIGLLEWSGSMSTRIFGARKYDAMVGSWGQTQSDFAENFAVLCLDLVEVLLMEGQIDVPTESFADALADLADRIEAAALNTKPKKARGAWWQSAVPM